MEYLYKDLVATAVKYYSVKLLRQLLYF